MANRLKAKDVVVKIGDLVRVHQTYPEKDKEKTQTFEGRVIAIKGRSPNKTYTVRRLAAGNIGVEKIFPADSPTVTKIEVEKSTRARRAKLYYLRDKTGRVTKTLKF